LKPRGYLIVILGLLFGAFMGVGMLFMPESPRWLMRREREEDARRSLRHVYPEGDGPNTVESELREIQSGIIWERQQPKATWSDIFRFHNKTFYRTALGVALQVAQQFTGINVFFYFGASIFVGKAVTRHSVVLHAHTLDKGLASRTLTLPRSSSAPSTL
jgi:SP family sugar:H+ symporter-like MFS transporter